MQISSKCKSNFGGALTEKPGSAKLSSKQQLLFILWYYLGIW